MPYVIFIDDAIDCNCILLVCEVFFTESGTLGLLNILFKWVEFTLSLPELTINMGKIVNRPKYVTDLGKLIVFPIPSALGAFTGYKLSYYLIQLLN